MKGRPAAGRSVARRVLQRVQRDSAYANLALSGELARHRELPAAERALATELVYGTLRHQRFLDHAIEEHVRRRGRAIDPEVRVILRVAAYQLLFLSRVPGYAAVDEAVTAARALRGAQVAGFVNAVLRRIAAEPASREACAELPLRCSLPDALARELVGALGPQEAAQLAEALLTPAALVARVNTARAQVDAAMETLRGEGAEVTRAHYAPGALSLRGLASPFHSASYLGGLWTAQDEAAQLVTLLLGPVRGERVLDACAGVGGKSTHLAELGARDVVCWDINERKLQLLEEHALRLGLRCETHVGDFAAAGEQLDGSFTRVLVDAPCSGIGVLRRHPELKWRDPGPRDELLALQRRLLTRAVAALAPGGVLVYSVCTITEDEGPGQLAWLLDGFSELELERPAEAGPLQQLAPRGELRLWPHRHGMDGFYAARLRKTKDER